MSIPLPPLLPQYLGGVSSGIGGGGDEDPSRNRSLKSTHEVDPIPAISPDPGDGPEPRPIVKRQRRIPDGPLRCAVCRRTFKSAKALHGHMRCHPERNWRGVAPPGQESGSEKEAAASLVMLSEKGKGKAEEEEDEEVVVGIGGGDLFRCEWCKTGFRTRQALGGHRASHKSKKGCYMKGKEKEGVKGKNVMVAAEMAKVAAKRRRFEVDLNLPPPPEEEEEEENDKKD